MLRRTVTSSPVKLSAPTLPSVSFDVRCLHPQQEESAGSSYCSGTVTTGKHSCGLLYHLTRRLSRARLEFVFLVTFLSLWQQQWGYLIPRIHSGSTRTRVVSVTRSLLCSSTFLRIARKKVRWTYGLTSCHARQEYSFGPKSQYFLVFK